MSKGHHKPALVSRPSQAGVLRMFNKLLVTNYAHLVPPSQSSDDTCKYLALRIIVHLLHQEDTHRFRQ